MHPLQTLINDMMAAAAATMNPLQQAILYTLASGLVWLLNKIKRSSKVVLSVPARIVGSIGWFFVLCALGLTGGVLFNQPWLVYAIFIVMLFVTFSLRFIIKLLESLAPLMQANVPQIFVRRGVNLTHVDLGLQETLRDIAMCLLMCSAFNLDGPAIGLAPPPVVWISLATLVLNIITAPSTVTIRHRLMVGLTGLFVLPRVLYWFSPTTKEVMVGFNTFAATAQKATVAWLMNPMATPAHWSLVAIGIIWTLLLAGGTFWILHTVCMSVRTTGHLLPTPSPHQTTGTQATATPTATPTAGHGGGHGSADVPWKTIGITAAVVAALVLLVWIGLRIGQPPAQASTSSSTVVVTPALAAPSAPRQTVTDLQDFRVIKDGSADNEWEFQLDAREPWKTLPITVSDGDEVEFTATGLVCGGDQVGCASPKGQDHLAKTARADPNEFPVGDAFCQALVGRIGSYDFQVGDHKTYLVPAGAGTQPVQLMDNYRTPYISFATGGFRVKITIRKKT